MQEERSGGMIVEGWYVPNTPTLVVEPGWDAPGFAVRPRTLEALREAGRRARARHIDAVIVISPHFQARGLLPVVTAERPTQVYDFDGFPQPFFQVQYAPPGSREIAERIASEAAARGLAVTPVETEWGLDHGAWAPLSRMFPEADMATVPLGIGYGVSDVDHERMGEVVRAAVEGRRAVVVATGSLLHRLDLWGRPGRERDPAIEAALSRAEGALLSGDWEQVFGLPEADLHLLAPEGGLRPLRILAGAVGSGYAAEMLSNETEFGAASLSVVELLPSGART